MGPGGLCPCPPGWARGQRARQQAPQTQRAWHSASSAAAALPPRAGHMGRSPALAAAAQAPGKRPGAQTCRRAPGWRCPARSTGRRRPRPGCWVPPGGLSRRAGLPEPGSPRRHRIAGWSLCPAQAAAFKGWHVAGSRRPVTSFEEDPQTMPLHQGFMMLNPAGLFAV